MHVCGGEYKVGKKLRGEEAYQEWSPPCWLFEMVVGVEEGERRQRTGEECLMYHSYPPPHNSAGEKKKPAHNDPPAFSCPAPSSTYQLVHLQEGLLSSTLLWRGGMEAVAGGGATSIALLVGWHLHKPTSLTLGHFEDLSFNVWWDRVASNATGCRV